MAELDSQNGRLQFIEATVDPGNFADVSLFPTIFSQGTHAATKLFVIGCHRAPISECSEVLRRIETECRDITEGSDLTAFPSCTVSLRAVLNHSYSMSGGDVHNVGHLRWMSV